MLNAAKHLSAAPEAAPAGRMIEHCHAERSEASLREHS
jgi:hypothetical protein